LLYPEGMLRLLKRLGAGLIRTEDLLLAQTGMVRPGLANLLLGLTGKDGVITGIAQQHLADMMFVNRGTAQKCLNELRAERVIDWTRSRIDIVDADQLRRRQWSLEGVA
jgi:CRP-like cAMP-binding protein